MMRERSGKEGKMGRVARDTGQGEKREGDAKMGVGERKGEEKGGGGVVTRETSLRERGSYERSRYENG